jgi:restriction endonuclease
MTWPTLTAQHVKKYLKKSEATIKGHMKKIRKNVQSTHPKVKPTKQQTEELFEPHLTARTNVVYAEIQDLEGHPYTDLTGGFRKTSSRGYKYILVLYDYDGNNIQAEPIKNSSDTEAIRSYTRIYNEHTRKWLKPTFQTMDNEASKAQKQFLHSKDIPFQLVDPHVHRQNATEQAIQTFKHHFVAILCATEKQFPLHLWDRLISQAVLTLNLLRKSRKNPKLLAHAQLQGQFDYNATPLSPPGTKVTIHENPDQ